MYVLFLFGMSFCTRLVSLDTYNMIRMLTYWLVTTDCIGKYLFQQELVLFVGKFKFTNLNQLQLTLRTLIKKILTSIYFDQLQLTSIYLSLFQPTAHQAIIWKNLTNFNIFQTTSTHFNKKYSLQSISIHLYQF